LSLGTGAVLGLDSIEPLLDRREEIGASADRRVEHGHVFAGETEFDPETLS
jgi:hypothetical protein